MHGLRSALPAWHEHRRPSQVAAILKDCAEDGMGDRRQELVFIGVNVDREAITALLDGCLLSDSEMAECGSSAGAGHCATAGGCLRVQGCFRAAARLSWQRPTVTRGEWVQPPNGSHNGHARKGVGAALDGLTQAARAPTQVP